jgi:uncharacterized lipoprotein YddW (UPF0748 family)
MKLLLYTMVFILLGYNAEAQLPKYEFRGLWIATIGNIDWPSSGKAESYVQQAEMISLLNNAKAIGINAIIIQVRPTADALYQSSFEGWSKYVGGIYPGYDPLAFIISECHKRAIEVHAWFNPYRAQVFSNKNPHPLNHVTYTHPEWFVNYGGKKYFDPGIPAVRKYVQAVVAEVVEKYDIDAVHFDDYFYPYKVAGKDFPDQKSYLQYGNSFTNKNDWRRNNVDLFIQEMNQQIKKIKPYIKLGISPFGVWRNISNDTDGSNTTAGVQNYDDLYADVIKWQKLGWIDYLLPQLYWEIGHKAADFYTLTEWWNRHAYNRAMYIGQGLYQVGVNKKAAWQNNTELRSQINMIRQYNNLHGCAWYSAVWLAKDKLGAVSAIKNNEFANIAIVPPMKWLDSIAPKKPIVKIKSGTDNYALEVKASSPDTWAYVLYKFNKNEKINTADATKIEQTFFDTYCFTKLSFKDYKYVITAIDRVHNESEYVIIE